MKKDLAVVMGSRSDLAVIQHTLDILDSLKISYDVKVLSAHRTPAQTIRFAKSAQANGYNVIIAAAGGAAHLAGVIAAHTTLPVIGIPVETKSLGGVDSLFSTVQMPSGIPVGCMAIGKAGAVNAAVFAAEMLAVKQKNLRRRLLNYKRSLANKVLRG